MVQPDTLPPSAVDPETSFRMADVGAKSITHRVALAEGFIKMEPETFKMIRDKRIPKGDCLALAEVAGILAAKNTPQILPLCHPLSLEKIAVSCFPDSGFPGVKVTCRVSTHGKTGVEMEALAGVQGALLCIYDLCKPHDPAMEISGVRLVEKTGGKSGRWLRETPDAGPNTPLTVRSPGPWEGLRLCLLTVSDRAHAGSYEDLSGPELERSAKLAGAEIVGSALVPDNIKAIQTCLMNWLEATDPDCVLISGGTGPAPGDLTPEALLEIADRELTGVGEILRKSGADHTPFSWLSRSLAIIKNRSLVIALPGKPVAVREGIGVLSSLVPHAVSLIRSGKNPH